MDDHLRAHPGGIDLVEEPDRSLVRMWGDVDAGLRDQASATMVRLLSRRCPVVVDVADVSFIDSSGIAFILQVHRIGEDDGTGMVLLDPPDHVLDLLDIVGMTQLIRCETSRPPAEETAPADGSPHADGPLLTLVAPSAEEDDGLALTSAG